MDGQGVALPVVWASISGRMRRLLAEREMIGAVLPATRGG